MSYWKQFLVTLDKALTSLEIRWNYFVLKEQSLKRQRQVFTRVPLRENSEANRPR